MTEMNATGTALLPVAALLLALLLPAVATAQAPDEEEIGPAVETSEIGTTRDATRAAEIDAVEPGVQTDGVTRSTSGNRVMDSMELGRTEITGNQELPKVLYIVPWKKADPGDLMGRPVNTLLDEVLAPIDREEFIRQVDYYHDLNGGEDE